MWSDTQLITAVPNDKQLYPTLLKDIRLEHVIGNHCNIAGEHKTKTSLSYRFSVMEWSREGGGVDLAQVSKEFKLLQVPFIKMEIMRKVCINFIWCKESRQTFFSGITSGSCLRIFAFGTLCPISSHDSLCEFQENKMTVLQTTVSV